ncbi:MAG: CBS domain-containing protein [Chloroflexota bacterium]
MNTLRASPKVKDIMTREVVTVRPDTPVAEIACLLTTHRIGGVPVVDGAGRVVGIVSESDLFLKEEPLPRTRRTFPALFKVPVLPNRLLQAYAMRRPKCVAADVMTRKVVWVSESDSLGKAVCLIVRHGIKRLPVLTTDPEAGGTLVGMLTRADVIRLLCGQTQRPTCSSSSSSRPRRPGISAPAWASRPCWANCSSACC